MFEPSTRTPEGEPNRCPVCGQEVRIEPSRPPGDAPCPHCGHLLWFARAADFDRPRFVIPSRPRFSPADLNAQALANVQRPRWLIVVRLAIPCANVVAFHWFPELPFFMIFVMVVFAVWLGAVVFLAMLVDAVARCVTRFVERNDSVFSKPSRGFGKRAG